MPDELSALSIIGDAESFDFGSFEVPVTRRVSPWKPWHYVFTVALVAVLTLLVYNGPASIESEIAYHGERAWWTGWGATFVFAGLDLFLVLLLFASPLMGATVRLDRMAVEVWCRGLDLRRRHFKEPLANYRGVVMAADDEGRCLVALSHPDPAKTLPLYRGDEQTARLRQENARLVLRLPALDGPP